jgi:transmembrane sensor
MLERVAVGQASAADGEAVERWIALDPRRRAELDLLRRIVGGARALGAADFDAQANLARAETRLGLPAASGARTGAGKLPHIGPQATGAGAAWRAGTIAASVLVALGIGWGVAISRHRGASGGMGAREYATAAGQRLIVTLVDGTQLTLAPATRVRVAADYGRSARVRDVELEGEAYFAVVHDAARPFAVRARGVITRDVGTAFDVRAYPEDVRVRVAVAEGRVSLAHSGSGRSPPAPGSAGSVESTDALEAGDIATVADGGVAVTHNADIAAELAWMRGDLVMRNVALRDALPMINRWYGITLVLGDSLLASRHLSATLPQSSIQTFLGGLAPAVGARYTVRADNTYVLSSLP